ncbi:MAG TPA: VWA domain-containing protein [Desulfurococcales archaeon]|nr:VWA domain-containing protein [Desulfurococcales archaeon]
MSREPLNKSIIENSILHTTIPENIVFKVINLANELRRHGVNVGISEVITALKMFETYIKITGGNVHDYNTLYMILRTVFVKREREEKVFDSIVSKLYTENVVKDLIKQTTQTLKTLGLKYNDKVYSRRKILQGKTREERRSKLEAYTTLKKLGIIYRDEHGREKVVSRNQAEEIIRRVLSKIHTKSLSELAQKVWEDRLGRIPSYKIREYADIISVQPISIETLEKLPTHKLLEIAKVLEKTSNKSLPHGILDEIIKRLEAGTISESTLYNDLIDILMKYERLDPKTITLILLNHPKAVCKLLKLSSNTLATLKNILPQLPIDKQAEIVKRLTSLEKLVSPSDVREILKSISPYAFKGIGSKGISKLSSMENLLVKSLSSLARAYEYSIEAVKSGNIGYTNLAFREYEKAINLYREYERVKCKQGSSVPDYKFLKHLEYNFNILRAIVEPSLNGDSVILPNRILLSSGGVDYVTTIRELSILYDNVVDERVRNEILLIASRIAHKLRDKLKSHIVTFRKEVTLRRTHRIALRRTLYNLIRYHTCILYKSRRREGKVILVVDVSGSMRDYAEWAILASSAFSYIVSHLILFSHNVTVYDKSVLKNPRNITKILFNLKFYGWTDIVKALEESEKVARENKINRIIVVSDLKQTVRRSERIEDVVSRFTKRKLKLLFIVPPVHDNKTALTLRNLGVKVVTLKDAKILPRKLLSLIT